MERGGQESHNKSQLVSEICSIPSCYIVCIHRHGSRNHIKSHFTDWYRILGVDQAAGTDIIRRKYHKLALQVHPDKNNHPKAEFAFKLVSEAYACLSDKSQRRAFDSERRQKFCPDCNRLPFTKTSSLDESNISTNHKARSSTRKPSSSKLWKGLKDITERFKEENRVIENCLRTNGKPFSISTPTDCLLRRHSLHRAERETPIFNPADYVLQGYPHLRAQVCKRADRFWYMRGGTKYDSPIFEVKSERAVFSSKPACVRS